MATRRSARFSAKAESTPVAIASSSDSESTKRKTLKRRPRKQQKLDIDVAASTAVVQDRTDYSRVRGRRGHLKLMTEMPVDILLEIFSRLEPIDLLHLSRASKILHNLLTSSNSTYIWRLVCSSPFRPFHVSSTPAFVRLTKIFVPLCVLPRVSTTSTSSTIQIAFMDVTARQASFIKFSALFDQCSFSSAAPSTAG